MRVFLQLLCVSVFGLFFLNGCSESRDRQILVLFEQTNPQASQGISILRQLGENQNFKVDTTSQFNQISEEQLQQYSAVLLLGLPTDTLSVQVQTNVERLVQAGGGLVAINAPIQAKYTWPWYESVLKSQPEVIENPEYQQTPVELTSVSDKAENQSASKQIKRPYDGGQFFYLGGQDISTGLESDQLQATVLEGIEFAIGDNQLNYAVARSLPVPEDNRFVKKVLIPGPLNEPTELTILPDGKVVFTERKGAVKMYFPETESYKTIAQLDVHTKFEDGLMGIAKDPDFYHNNWIYLYYSPVGDKPVQHLSRFLLLGDSLIMSSEKLIMEVDVQRDECCHTGGSIAFGPNGLLYLSTGDDTNPFQSDGYAPIDERPGRAPFDAQGSSGNSNDLRGKVLRIRVNDDATYSIPDNNLFPKDGSVGRPEIYTMGTRNSYRISIDQKTGWLYWGDVGNDARVDSERGPKGYDEINQAKEAGNHGWPHFRGNRAYPDYDFATGEIGEYFDFNAPVNNSPNNTGTKVLPPFKKALIWYPYDDSPEFPILGKGGRNAMAGPVYHYDHFPHSDTKLPKYYDEKLFIYDWMRNWIIAVTLDNNGDLVRLEPFLDSTKFVKIIDMEMGPDGSIYLLEYGTDWFAKNPDASLSKIDYFEGNRAPVVQIAADETVGAAPLTVNFSSEGSFDYDEEDQLSYQWHFTDADNVQSEEANPSFTFDAPGIYSVKLTTLDDKGESTSKDIEIQVGNQPPAVDIQLASNQTFYWDNAPIAYQVVVEDQEDGSLQSGIDPQNVNFAFNFVPGAATGSEDDMGHKMVVDGLSLIENSGCKACHGFEKQSVGPAYNAVAERYERSEEVTTMLVNKILQGGMGNWGDRAMPAQAVSREEAENIVDYILSIDEASLLPLQGSFVADQHLVTGSGTYELTVKYKDQGGDPVGSLTREKTIMLRNPKVEAELHDERYQCRPRQPSQTNYAFMTDMRDGSYFTFENFNLQGIDMLQTRVAANQAGITLEVRLDAVDGDVVAETAIPATGGATEWTTIDLPIQRNPKETHTLYFVTRASDDNSAKASVDWIYFQNSEVDSRVASR
ncbi:PQQ-dependent sugar dehydrogenase [Tunicatimonas pelagia]|uniref:PQQ-dependent sugar dehydrogenase n=1 Tax=Tunicatimonas pelagia TaxID=931531 RepID=UPI00266580D7|nr:PQQ-dependent sugar dehydrogenase [Tunicatimonas pelagia]WKN46117.1 PQQ-dependent sugar dehydrogenase [Tunicatimonas pelagia]